MLLLPSPSFSSDLTFDCSQKLQSLHSDFPYSKYRQPSHWIPGQSLGQDSNRIPGQSTDQDSNRNPGQLLGQCSHRIPGQSIDQDHQITGQSIDNRHQITGQSLGQDSQQITGQSLDEDWNCWNEFIARVPTYSLQWLTWVWKFAMVVVSMSFLPRISIFTGELGNLEEKYSRKSGR